jgi:hypothetical protein
MAESNSSSGKVDLEEVAALVKQAEAVACLVHSDDSFDESIAKTASGAVSTLLQQALKLLEPEAAA